MIRRTQQKPRSAFTLIELLVAMALAMFIMVILTQSFITSMDTFRELKGIGDMERNLRTAVTLLRSDLRQDHFVGKRRLSDPGFWNEQVREGFFRIHRIGSVQSNEGVDADTLPSYFSVNHRLHFSVKRRGNKRADFFTASAPRLSANAHSPLLTTPTNFFNFQLDASYQSAPAIVPPAVAPPALPYTSQWAEVMYFLRKTGTTTDPIDPTNATGTALYALYRVQKLVVPYPKTVNDAQSVPSAQFSTYDASVSCRNSGYVHFLSPTDIVNQTITINNAQIDQRGITNSQISSANPTVQGALVLANVVNFNVRIIDASGNTADMVGDTDPTSPQHPDNPGVSNNAFRFIHGVQIILRVWDQKTEQARQVTVIQDL